MSLDYTTRNNCFQIHILMNKFIFLFYNCILYQFFRISYIEIWQFSHSPKVTLDPSSSPPLTKFLFCLFFHLPTLICATHMSKIFTHVWPSIEHDQHTKGFSLKANWLSFSRSLSHQLPRAAEIGAGVHVHPLHNAKICSYLVLHGECACCHNHWQFMCVPSYHFWGPLFRCIYSPPLTPLIYLLTFPQWSLSI